MLDINTILLAFTTVFIFGFITLVQHSMKTGRHWGFTLLSLVPSFIGITAIIALIITKR